MPSGDNRGGCDSASACTRKESKLAKKIVGFVKLQVPAGKANPSPPIGPALGQRGLNIMEFCKAFNAQTQNVEPGLPLPVVITAYQDKSFTFIIKTPPTSVLIRKAIGLEKGSPKPHVDKVVEARQLAEAVLPAEFIEEPERQHGPDHEAEVNHNQQAKMDADHGAAERAG